MSTYTTEYSYYRITSEVCSLFVRYTIENYDSAFGEMITDTVIDTYGVTNDPSSIASGTFDGSWIIPGIYNIQDSVIVYGEVVDEENFYIRDTLTLYRDSLL